MHFDGGLRLPLRTSAVRWFRLGHRWPPRWGFTSSWPAWGSRCRRSCCWPSSPACAGGTRPRCGWRGAGHRRWGADRGRRGDRHRAAVPGSAGKPNARNRPRQPGHPNVPAGDHPDSVANHRLGRPAAAGPPLRVSPPSPAAETADPRTGWPAPRRRARWSANRRTPAYAGPQRRTAKPAAAGQSVSPSELPRLPGPGHRVQAGGSALGGPFVEEIRNCVGHGHVRQA
jgi:hypothetical protein